MHQIIITRLIFIHFIITSTTAYGQVKTLDMQNANQVTSSKANTPQTLAHQIFQALQSGNAKQWEALYPSNAEYKNLLQLMLTAKQDGLTQERVDAMVAQQKREATATYKSEYSALQKQATHSGVDWKKATYSDFIFDASPTAIPRKYVNGDIWFNMGRVEFAVEGIEAVETESGYKLQAVKGIRKLQEAD